MATKYNAPVSRNSRRSAIALKIAHPFAVVTYDVHGYVIDTHTADGWGAAVDYAKDLRDSNPMVSLSDIDEVL